MAARFGKGRLKKVKQTELLSKNAETDMRVIWNVGGRKKKTGREKKKCATEI